ncbi:glycoside hydrolase family 31 protein [Limosilactobacillus sp. STM2_1]|uniref:Glycoside hydrolase family 31 protein n=1 Tax=Limosilactobacillus rudii TaxID=2759755 RepID=A0A7W3UNH6_9LACO|nr:glycoside hydrolase family 31 protein [Limosilactobacillus rudii]MBB1078914.1 glycoside hydrolase family 31 protein [Limosilactobacillus rudii]MBB1098210.1 glycoside hydrolase family 31 protein [Limosilactobacillus rudii]MCD7135675.1 glycoside hydrolase family 31 protein [Limosilactobacillus rudii]
MNNQVKGYATADQKITINYQQSSLTLSIITPEIIRVFQDHGEKGQSYAIEGNKVIKTDFDLFDKGDHLELLTAALIVKIYDDEKIDVYDRHGHPLVIDYRGKRTPIDRGLDEEHAKLVAAEGHDVAGGSDQDETYFEVIKSLATDEQIYGLGDKTGYLNKRGYEYDNWNTDNPAPQVESFTRLYKSIPFMLGLKEGHPYGLFFDDPYRSHFDLGKENSNYYYYSAVAGNLDYYIIGGQHLRDIVTNYTYLTGRVPLPQKWVLGYQQSRWGYSASPAKVEEIANKLRENDLPCDVIHFDIDYMDGYRVFTWNKDKFTNPQEFIHKLKDQGFRVMPIIDPGVKQDKKYRIYKEGLKRGYFVKNPDGTVYVNKVWPGDAVFPDFGKKEVQQWWADNCKFLVDSGTCGVWNDMNEPATFEGNIPDDVIFSDGEHKSTHKKMHNVYGHNMAKATYQGLKKHSHKRPYVITRAAYAGTQKYSTIWTGDNQSLWPHLQMMIPQLCNLSMSGFAFAGTDIGGFGADATAELLTRWIEGALFSPLYRNHASMGTRSQEPWVFGEPTLSIYRKYLKLRYHFIPFLYDLSYQETKTGLGIMRPLVLNYDNDPAVRTINDEYMVGNQLLVAPIVQEGQDVRAVYLPEGEWIDFWNGMEYVGKRHILVKAPIDKLPLFVKKDTILPWGPEINHVSDAPDKAMNFRMYGQKGEYLHYQDNGLDFAYQEGEYNLYQIKVDNNQVDVTLINAGYDKFYKEITVETENQKYSFVFDKQTKRYIQQ